MAKPQRPTAGKHHHGGAKRAVTKRGAKPPDGAKKKKLRSVKNQIRGLERLLKKEGLDPRVHAQKQRELQQLHEVQVARVRSDLERKYAVRYHRVRFFERVKVERAMQRLQAQQEGGEPLDPAVQRQLDKLRDDLMYIKHFPKGEKYVSLLRNSDDPEAQAKLEAERARLRQLMKQQLQEAAAIAEADEGRSLGAVAAGAAAFDTADGTDEDAYELGTDSSDDDVPAGGDDGGSDDEAATAALAAARLQKQHQCKQEAGQPAQQQAGKRPLAQPTTSPAPAKRMRPQQQQAPSVPAPAVPGFASDDDFFLSEGDEGDSGDDAGADIRRAAADGHGADGMHAAATTAAAAAAAAGAEASKQRPGKPGGLAGSAGKQQGAGKPYGQKSSHMAQGQQERHTQQRKQQPWGGGPPFGVRAGKPQGKQDSRTGFQPRQVQDGAGQRPPAAFKQHGAHAAANKPGRPQQERHQPAGPSASRPQHKSEHHAAKGPSKAASPKQPVRKRAEGGRKRRSKK